MVFEILNDSIFITEQFVGIKSPLLVSLYDSFHRVS